MYFRIILLMIINLRVNTALVWNQLSCYQNCPDVKQEICCDTEKTYYNPCYAYCDGLYYCQTGPCSQRQYIIQDEKCFKEIHSNHTLTLSLNDFDYDTSTETAQKMDIGILVNPIQPYIFCYDEINYRYLPTDTMLYKALYIPEDGLLSQQNVLNRYAARHGWFGTKEVAESYANSPWGQSQGWKVMQFKTIKDLKLFQLNIRQNIVYLYDSILDDINWYQSNKITIETEIIDSHSLQHAIEYNEKIIKEKELWLDILKLTLGIDVDYNEQIELVLKYGNSITSDYSSHPKDKIMMQLNGEIPNNFYFFKTGDQQNYRLQTQYLTTWGSHLTDLNRISFTTDIDRILCDIISTYTNTDGYIASDMPSLFEIDGRLISEIALFKARDAIKNYE